MELYVIRMPKKLLDLAPEQERTFFLMAGQLANDLNILNKLLWHSMNEAVVHEVIASANSVVTMLMVKMLAGRINEAWNVVGSQFSPMFKKYEQDLSEEAKSSLSKLKKYFGRSNLINKIRNRMSFHTDVETIKRAYAALPEDATLVDYLSNHRGHCLYYSGELVALLGMLDLLDNMPWQYAIQTIAKETTDVSVWLQEFVLGFITAFEANYLSQTITDLDKNKITLPDGPPIDTVVLPFFCAPPLKHS